MSLYKSLFITSVVISTLLINTPEVLAEHYIKDIYIEETQYYIDEPATPIGGISLILDDYYDTLEHENEPRIALMSLVEESCTDLEVPSKNAFKSYMDYRKVTNKKSNQYKQRLEAYTNELGLRMYEGRYCIAVGTYYAKEIGTKLDVFMENGSILQCVVGEFKDDGDTDVNNQQHKDDDSVIEFIIDEKIISKKVIKNGTVSALGGDFEGEIDYIRRFETIPN